MVAETDTLVIGGGLIGLSLAWELAGRGQRVTVLEAKTCGAAASWAGVGILPPVAQRHLNDPLEQLRTLSHDMLAQWSQELTTLTGQDTGYRRCGGIYVATTPGEAATLAANRAYWDELGIDVQSLSPSQLSEDQPELTPLAQSGRIRSAVFMPGECQLRTPHYVRALIAGCKLRGVRIEESSEVVGLDQSESGIEQVVVRHGNASDTYRANTYCLTAGPWTTLLLQKLQVASGIMPIRGQVLLFRSQRQLLTRIVNEGNRYLVPRDDGHILVGSNEEEVGFQCHTTADIVEELQQWAFGFMPALKEATFEKAWAGLRPGSFDTYPYIGKLPGKSNVFVAAGHYRAGIHLSAGTARVLSELITTGHSSIDLEPFRAGRG